MIVKFKQNESCLNVRIQTIRIERNLAIIAIVFLQVKYKKGKKYFLKMGILQNESNATPKLPPASRILANPPYPE
jgi:hypothetical protein